MEDNHIAVGGRLHIQLYGKAAFNRGFKRWDRVFDQAMAPIVQAAMRRRTSGQPKRSVRHRVLGNQRFRRATLAGQINAKTGKSLLETHGTCISKSDVNLTGHGT
jgi:hypothetical protein